MKLDAEKELLQLRHELAKVQGALIANCGGVVDASEVWAKYVPVEVQRIDQAHGTIFSFGGLNNRPGMPVKEFFYTLTNAKYNVVFVKDFAQVWYQQGLKGISGTRSETADFLLETFEDLPRPWIFIGNSAGAYAAIYFGQKINADRVVAFSPQTLVDRKTFIHFSGVLPRSRSFFPDDDENDLLYTLGKSAKPEVEIHYGTRNPTDRGQAHRVSGIEKVTLCQVDTRQHIVSRTLKNKGKLVSTIIGSDLTHQN